MVREGSLEQFCESEKPLDGEMDRTPDMMLEIIFVMPCLTPFDAI